MNRLYFNSTMRDMNIPTVAEHIINFIKKNPNGNFKVMIGTDSQLIGDKTCFATGIVVHKQGGGAWCCICKQIEPRRFNSLREKIHMETSITYQVICELNDLILLDVSELLLASRGSSLHVEAHIDVGHKGATRVLIREMMGYFEGIGIEAKIKPYSYVASTYANRHTKRINTKKELFEASYVYSPYIPVSKKG